MKNQTERKAKTDAHHKEVAETLIKMIEAGTAPWQKPWDGNISAQAINMPFNGASNRRYRGINSLYLYSVAYLKGYKDPRWFTYKQVEELGGNVKRGEKAAKVEYWKFTATIKEDSDGKPLPKEEWFEVDRKVPLVMRSAVFNAEQCENIPELVMPKRDWEPLERAETIIKANGVPVFHDAVDMNYYSHGKDEIHLTAMESFKTKEAYYGTALHELGHSTGHEKRLNRTFGKSFGDENYAREELRAEIASFMLCADLGISRDASDAQHAAYVGSWIKALKEDPNEIFKASADAEAICNYLYDREREYVKSLENGQTLFPNVLQPEIKPAVNQVDELVAGYALPNIGANNGMERKGYYIDSVFTTNYVEDGTKMFVYIVDGKSYLGKSSNIKYQPEKDEVGNDVMLRYYDNTDGSLVHLHDKPEMGLFLAFRSVDVLQDSMATQAGIDVLGKMNYVDFVEAKQIEENVLSKYDLDIEYPPKYDENLITIDAASISNWERNGKRLDVFIKNDSVYMGESDRYINRGIYDNSDYSLVKISDNRKMFHLLYGKGYVTSQEELVKHGEFSEYDFKEYANLKNGVLKDFDEVRQIMFDDEPFKSPFEAEVDRVANEAMAREAANELGDNPFAGMTEIVNFIDTNFEKDGKRISMIDLNGEVHYGYSDNVKINAVMGDTPQSNKIVAYYDNSDDSLTFLGVHTNMEHFISGMSYGRSQDEMLMVPNTNGFEAAFTSIQYENWEFLKAVDFADFKHIEPVEAREEDYKIRVNDVGSIGYSDSNNFALRMFEKQGTYFIGKEANYDRESGTYDNSDLKLFRVTDNVRVKDLIVNDELDLKAALDNGSMTQNDLAEYTLFREQSKGIFFGYGRTDLVHNRRMSLLSDDYLEKYPFLNKANIVPTNFEDRVLISSDEGVFLGKRQNMLPVFDGVDSRNKIYDNKDGSLVKISENLNIADIISDRSFGYNMKTIMEVYEGNVTVKDFEEYNKIYDEHLSKLKFGSEYEDMGKFDVKEAMKMADEQVQAPVAEEKTFNPPSDAQLALAETLHCKYKEGVSREELAKIIAKRREAIKKYNDAISQPAKEEQIESLKQAGVEIKEGLTIGEASKIIAALPATVQTKVFMDRLKLEYAPEITRGEAAKLIDAKLKEFEKEEKQPATEKTIEYMKKRGIEVPENVTRGEANKLIYNSAPTAKQMVFIDKHKIECDKEKLTYGKAKILIEIRIKELNERMAGPATENMKARLTKEKVEFKPDITYGEASKIIRGIQLAKLEISEKQVKYANDLGVEIPEGATKAQVSKLIGVAVRNNDIAKFEVPTDRKLTLEEGYKSAAKKFIEKGKEIDDKKIAGELLKQGHRECDVKTAIHKLSPNCVNDLAKAQGLVNEAKKLPSVKKAMEKENSR